MATSFFNQIAHEFERPFQNPVLVFAVILFIILLSPILLRKLKIPGIIGLIISGVIIGPHGINVLEQNSAVKLFSTIGLLYIMFIAGLELDLKEFQRNKNKSLVFGFLTFTIPLVIGFPVCYYFLDYSFTASLLISSMFSTHTMVSYPIVSKFGISKNEAVAITVGGTILTDTAVLILLAIILSSNNGDLSLAFWMQLAGSLAVFTGIMFWIIPRVTAWFFQKLESEKTSHYIFVLSVVFFAAFLAELAGVEPIIGAFVAGLALNKLIPYSSSLMNRIEFIGNAIFIPFFLISVGMLVDMSVLLKGPTALIIAVTLSLVAITAKWLAASATSSIFRYSPDQRKLIFGLSSSHAAATLAVIMVGFQTKIIGEYVLNGTILLILVTCLIATLVTENASRRILTSEKDEPVLKNSISEDEHIMMPIANLSNMELLLELAIFIKNKKSLNPITILSVVPNNEEAEKNLIIARKNLQSLVKMASATETKINLIATIDHNIAGGIIRASREIMADTIIIGWPGKTGLIERFIETKTASIISRTSKSVYVCQFKYPLVSHKKLVVVCPPLGELEHGFGIWISRVTALSKELSLDIFCYCNSKSKEAVASHLKQHKLSLSITFSVQFELSDLELLHQHVLPEDLFIYIAARRASVSYDICMENIQEKLERQFSSTSKIIIYPRSYHIDSKYTEYGDINSEPLNQGFEKFQKIGKDLGNLLKRDHNKS
ncbi:MAG TPA: cation:proton antiporter [Prolixibacteraceae bacterium]|nr:cation:proton antiporter [Prolixibacteraceae bacterium]